MRDIRLPFILLFSLTLIAGCESDSSVSTQESGEAPIEASEGTPNTFGQPPQMSKAEREKASHLSDQSSVSKLEQLSKVGTRFRGIVKDASDWNEAHQKLRERLQGTENSPVPNYLREQIAALSMFRTVFTDWGTDLSEEQREAVGFYTELLVTNRSPESTFVLSGLEKVEGHWSDSKVAEYARIARRSAADTYGTDQPKTSSSEEGGSESLQSAKQRHTVDISEANGKLKRMAGRLSDE